MWCDSSVPTFAAQLAIMPVSSDGANAQSRNDYFSHGKRSGGGLRSGRCRNKKKQSRRQKPRFQGRCKELKGVVYDLAAGKDAFLETTKVVAEYVAQTFKNAEEFRIGLVELSFEELIEPARPADPNNDAEVKAWVKDLSTYYDKIESRRMNSGRTFALVLGQCSRALRDCMESDTHYAKINASSDIIGLLQLIRRYMTRQHAHQCEVHGLLGAEGQTSNIQQGHRVSESDQYSDQSISDWLMELYHNDKLDCDVKHFVSPRLSVTVEDPAIETLPEVETSVDEPPIVEASAYSEENSYGDFADSAALDNQSSVSSHSTSGSFPNSDSTGPGDNPDLAQLARSAPTGINMTQLTRSASTGMNTAQLARSAPTEVKTSRKTPPPDTNEEQCSQEPVNALGLMDNSSDTDLDDTANEHESEQPINAADRTTGKFDNEDAPNMPPTYEGHIPPVAKMHPTVEAHTHPAVETAPAVDTTTPHAVPHVTKAPAPPAVETAPAVKTPLPPTRVEATTQLTVATIMPSIDNTAPPTVKGHSPPAVERPPAVETPVCPAVKTAPAVDATMLPPNYYTALIGRESNEAAISYRTDPSGGNDDDDGYVYDESCSKSSIDSDDSSDPSAICNKGSDASNNADSLISSHESSTLICSSWSSNSDYVGPRSGFGPAPVMRLGPTGVDNAPNAESQEWDAMREYQLIPGKNIMCNIPVTHEDIKAAERILVLNPGRLKGKSVSQPKQRGHGHTEGVPFLKSGYRALMTTPLQQILVSEVLGWNKRARAKLGAYMQTHEEHINDMSARALGAICLGTIGNEQDGHYFMSLSTGQRIERRKLTELSMPADVIEHVNQFGRRQEMPKIITFANQLGCELSDYPDDINDDHISAYDDDDDDDGCDSELDAGSDEYSDGDVADAPARDNQSSVSSHLTSSSSSSDNSTGPGDDPDPARLERSAPTGVDTSGTIEPLDTSKDFHKAGEIPKLVEDNPDADSDDSDAERELEARRPVSKTGVGDESARSTGVGSDDELVDIKTCENFDFKVILAGHDHHQVDEEICGTHSLKPVLDAIYAMVVDISWKDGYKEPTIDAHFVAISDWEPDAELAEECDQGCEALGPLRNSELAQVPPTFEPLSSVNACGKVTTMEDYICSLLRSSLNVHCGPNQENAVDAVLLMRGNIQAGTDCPEGTFFLMEASKAKIKLNEVVGIASVPGWVLPGNITLQMDDYLKNLLKEVPQDSDGLAPTPISKNLPEISEKIKELFDDDPEKFHHLTYKLLHLDKRVHMDLQTAFLCTCMTQPGMDDWKKLEHKITCLRGCPKEPLSIEATDKSRLDWWIDTSFVADRNMKGRIRLAMSIGKGCPVSSSTRQKIITEGSTKAELVSVGDGMTVITWTLNLLREQHVTSYDNLGYQDSWSAVRLGKCGRASSGHRTRHIGIPCFFMTDRIEQGELRNECCLTEDMVGDFFTKPLEKNLFRKLRAMNLPDDTSRSVTAPVSQECVGPRSWSEVVRGTRGTDEDLNQARSSIKSLIKSSIINYVAHATSVKT